MASNDRWANRFCSSENATCNHQARKYVLLQRFVPGAVEDMIEELQSLIDRLRDIGKVKSLLNIRKWSDSRKRGALKSRKYWRKLAVIVKTQQKEQTASPFSQKWKQHFLITWNVLPHILLLASRLLSKDQITRCQERDWLVFFYKKRTHFDSTDATTGI